MKLKRINLKAKYKGYTLVEMLITIVIIAVVLLTVTLSLTTMIKASAISGARTLARNDSEFILELLKKYMSNSSEDSVLLYNQSGRKAMINGDVVSNGALGFTEVAPDTGLTANEIHFRPVGSDSWICISVFPYFDGPKQIGTVIVKTSATGSVIQNNTAAEHRDCFGTDNTELKRNAIFLNSPQINIDSFIIRAYTSASENKYLLVNLTVTPVNWVAGAKSPVVAQYARRLIVSNEKLTF
ncbi:MAG: hypothetical protein Fur003_1190 [Candidatus Dojkabacteria bacterium]